MCYHTKDISEAKSFPPRNDVGAAVQKQLFLIHCLLQYNLVAKEMVSSLHMVVLTCIKTAVFPKCFFTAGNLMQKKGLGKYYFYKQCFWACYAPKAAVTYQSKHLIERYFCLLSSCLIKRVYRGMFIVRAHKCLVLP